MAMCIQVIPWTLNQDMTEAVTWEPFGGSCHCFCHEARSRSYQKKVILTPVGNSPLANISIYWNSEIFIFITSSTQQAFNNSEGKEDREGRGKGRGEKRERKAWSEASRGDAETSQAQN